MNPGGALYLLPILICGYCLGMIFWPTRFFLVRLDGQRLFLACAGIGLFWLSFLFILAHFVKLKNYDLVIAVSEFIHGAMAFPHASKIAIAIALSVIVPIFLNFIGWFAVGVSGSFWGRREKASVLVNRIAVKNYGGPLARMLTRAADCQIPVMVVLSSRKVYCGYVLEIGHDIDSDGYIGILPIKSFTREKDSLIFSGQVSYHAVEVSLVESALKVDRKSVGRYLCAYRRYVYLRRKFPCAFKIMSAIGMESPDVSELKLNLRRMIVDIRGRKKRLSDIGLGKEIVRKDWTKLIPVKSIDSVSYYEESAAQKWFNQHAEVGAASEVYSPALCNTLNMRL